VQVIHASFNHHYISVARVPALCAAHRTPCRADALNGSDRGADRVFTLSEAEGCVTAEDDQGSISAGVIYILRAALHHMLIKRFIDARPELIWIHAAWLLLLGAL
jgi:hypothetical protein